MNTTANILPTNMTTTTEFILLGFCISSKFRIPIVFLLILSYVITVLGNMLILTLVIKDQRLHSPMYYFLCNLATLEVCFINTVIPNMLNGFLHSGKYISLTACMSQFYTFFVIGAADFFLLSVMSFDRYVAICNPLRYTVIMNESLCMQLMVGVVVGAFFYTLIPSVLIMQLPFCCSKLDHFFCDIGPLLKSSCTDTKSVHFLEFATSTFLLFATFTVTVVSYIHIILAVLKIRSTDGRQKAFSTCTSHAVVVFLIYSSCFFMYVRPANSQSFNIDKAVAVVNSVVVPLLNPFIYALRNQKVKGILKEMIHKVCKSYFQKS